MFRIISVEGTKAVINSTITPNMTFTKTSQKFGQWSDVRANTVYGLGNFGIIMTIFIFISCKGRYDIYILTFVFLVVLICTDAIFICSRNTVWYIARALK